MKCKLLLLPALVLMISSCVTLPAPLPPVLASFSLDYSKYSKKGFIITEANSVSFEYTSIGSVSAINLGGEVLKEKGEPVSIVKGNDDAYLSVGIPKTKAPNIKVVAASQEAVLDEMYKKAIELGANGIINLKIQSVSNLVSWTGYSGFEASGMAIKR